LVIAYNPKGKFAPEFQAVARGKKPLKDLFTLLATKGLRLGRTNPATDPQGQAFYMMVELAQRVYHLPAGTAARILGAWDNPQEVFSEEGLPTQLEAGGLDAASAFLPQARQHHLSYIALPPSLDFAHPADLPLYHSVSLTIPQVGTVRGQLSLLYITVLNGKNKAAGDAFARFVLAKAQANLWRREGYMPISPAVWGQKSAIPKGLPH
jgi:molybdate/tungstate transport system substrate-binding protein